MSSLTNIDEILDFAIQSEEESHRFYTDLAEKVTKPWMKSALLEFAREELGHKAKVEAMKAGRLTLEPSGEEVPDLKIGDYLVEMEPHADMEYQEALVVAMKKEKAAYRLYMDLARRVTGEPRDLFLRLAQEEAKHKLRFETEYDEHVLAEN